MTERTQEIPDYLTTERTHWPASWLETPSWYTGPQLYRTLEYMADQDEKYPAVEAPKRAPVSDRVKIAHVVPVKAVPTRVCERCGQTFELPFPSSEKRFCSQACASRRHPRVEKVCVVCDKAFTVDYGNRHQQACSSDCGIELRRVKTVARHAAKRALEGRAA